MQPSDNNNYISIIPQARQLLQNGMDRIPNAVLIHGPGGLGKARFGVWLSNLLLCQQASPAGLPCGSCNACRLRIGGNHPDFRLVEPEGDDPDVETSKSKQGKRANKSIKIDQIRALESFVYVGSHQAGRRVILLLGAETMNTAAANALLKILEEPPISTYFLIVSSKFQSLLPTLISRCRKIPFTGFSATHLEQVKKGLGLTEKDDRYLSLSAGAAYRVADWKQEGVYDALDGVIESLATPDSDPVSLAARWEAILKKTPGFALEELVETVQRWNFDLALENLSGRVRYHSGWKRPGYPAGKLSPNALIAACKNLNQFRKSARHPMNQQLFLESMAAELLRSLRPVSS